MNKDLILREKLAFQRTILSNQTTFLAFLRTSMYFLVAGLTINNLLEVSYGRVIEYVFIFISFILFVAGVFNYRTQHKKILECEKHIGDYKDEYSKH
ncbi:DUF202 domain-containing protein [Runella sp. MFBS21]|uniref:DUF202 domain-containing protein n=1 Tax=Runella sp. MFBS21 TaxID=3034018 RepID=UPI0023F67A83|nr:DUF202 domain-containing protein [Runella sp. MFBS21]MDF7817077.1 DUF202 domain-containing protein [Runella sp. MFBS21]